MEAKDGILITFKKLEDKDLPILTALVTLYADVFEAHNFSLPNTSYLQSLLLNDAIIFFVALLNNTVIGGLTAYVLPSVYYPASQLYIYDVAVRADKQRQGVGAGLISYLKKYGIENGYKEMYVPAHVEDEHALSFYTATGGHAESVIHFSFPLSNHTNNETEQINTNRI